MDIQNVLSMENSTRHLLNTARQTLFKIIVIGVNTIAIREERMNSAPLKQKAGRFLKGEGS